MSARGLARMAVIGAVLTGCAAAPVRRTGDGEWAIAGAGRDVLRTDARLRTLHERQAAQICGGDGGHAEAFEPVPPDDLYHFRCIAPEHSRAEVLDRARVAWLECLEGAEPAVDDMLSDGHTVASVLATRCIAEFSQLQALAGKGYRWSLPEEAAQRIRRDVALDVVLRVRAQKRNPAATPPPVVIPPLGPGG